MNGLIHVPGSVAAGFPSPAADYMEERIDLAQYLVRHPSSTFYIRISGDSMQGAFMPSGALLVVDKSVAPQHGQIVVAAVNGDFTVKRLVQTRAGTFLAPENPNYKPIHLKDGVDVIIWGVVTYIITDASKV